ncbi:AAA family ATPase [Thalassospira sp. TSL5-1]|uniref:AAA family ATPase n=1 Tax=Thalassospira sp. TSL5-1 TaxID=1544451 RepID=UPI00093F6379|nr:AAA family ATPase [Thalassospira sp. TSL5-1]OKH89667.1 adenylylsulfate kinase [Thalassospira sp. TSL5-1]
MLIILGGLPGCGKSTLAEKLARALPAMWLRIDSIEQALRDADAQYGTGNREMGPEGYMAAYRVAEDNLRLGHWVIADSVNPIAITRDAWRDVASRAQARFCEIELVCSDAVLHRKRIENRISTVENLKLPDWQAVQNREYQPWQSNPLVLDSGLNDADTLFQQALAYIKDAVRV